MQLTNRQLFILSYLLNHPDQIGGDHLAAQAGISLRTLQSEIQDINQQLKNGIHIDAAGKKGYLVCGVVPEAREELLQQAKDRQSIYMPEERVNDIMTLLLFNRDYMNMETVANILFLSKTSVFRTFESSHALQKYVTVSHTQGVIINMPESRKRQLLSKVLDKDAQNPVSIELHKDYVYYDKLFRVMLINLFKRHSYAVSGEALRSFRRYLIISILRDKRDFPLEDVNYNLPISSLMTEIATSIRSVVGFTFSESEMQDCQAKLNSLCTFIYNVPEHRTSWQMQWEPGYQDFVRVLKNRYGLDFELDKEDKTCFLLHIHKLMQRVQSGQHDSNYQKREINRTYPLAVQIILLCFEECFGFEVPETEVSYLALYVAIRLNRHYNRIDCMIITANHPSTAWHMKRWLEEHFDRHLEHIEIVEHYRFSPKMVREDMLVLTTVEQVVFSCPQAILVKPLQLQAEYELIDLCINRVRTAARETFFKEYFGHCCSQIENISTRGKSFDQILEEAGVASQVDDAYEFVLDTDAFIIPRVHEGEGENQIRVLHMASPVVHRGTNLHYVVISDYYTQTFQMREFYYCLRLLLRPGKLDNLVQTGLE